MPQFLWQKCSVIPHRCALPHRDAPPLPCTFPILTGAEQALSGGFDLFLITYGLSHRLLTGSDSKKGINPELSGPGFTGLRDLPGLEGMNYAIEVKKRAVKDLENIPKSDALRIVEKIRELENGL